MRSARIQIFMLALIGVVTAALVVPVIANGHRICFAPGAVRAAVFMEPDRIEVYTIDGVDRGELQFSFSQTYLVTLPGRPARDLLLGSSEINIHVEMWRLTNGQYRVLAGPDGENKMHECIFGGSSARVRTYDYTGETVTAGDPSIPAEGTSLPTDAPISGEPTAPAPTQTEPTAEPTQPGDPTPVGTREVTFGG